MSYIDKNGNVVISARMTDIGRNKLHLGELTFNTFKFGDSEVDYTTLGSTYDITLQNVLRAKAGQTDIKTCIKPLPSSVTCNVAIPALTEFEIETIVRAPELGFFLTGSSTVDSITFTAQTTDYSLQSDAIINVSDLSGGTTVKVSTGTTFVSGSYEPAVGDLMLVKYSNPDLIDTQTNTVVELGTPVPYLWYKVQSKSGTLSADTLFVTVDRDLPDFTPYAGSNFSTTAFYPSGNQFSSDGFYSGGTVWNQNNVWSYPIAGVDSSTYETFNDYGSESYVGSKEFFGYTSELSGSCEQNKAISIIHYTNPETCSSRSEVTYGQKLYVDVDAGETPKIVMPTLMWHRSSGVTIGQSFSGTGLEQFVTLSDDNTTIRYFELSDEQANIVGRIFPEYQVLTISDEELVAALSYKSNRNWTLPTLIGGLKTAPGGDGLIGQTQDLHITYLFNNTTGFTAGLHCQNHTCVVIGENNEECPDGTLKDIEVTFPLSQLPFMTSGTTGTGWHADEFHIIAQKVTTGTLPDPTAWRIMDFTSSITDHTVGNKIDPLNLESSTFVITKALYDAASTYDLHDYINIPTIAETDVLQFGDEAFFYGNVDSSGVTSRFRTKFTFTAPPGQFNTSTNPTWPDSGQNVHISEVGVYDVNNNLVAVGKENLPIEKQENITILVELAFDV